MKHRLLLSVLLFVSIFASSLCMLYSGEERRQEAEIKSYLAVAATAIDPKKTTRINSLILSGADKRSIVADEEYQALVTTLKALTRALPVGAKWTYLIYPASPVDVRTIGQGQGKTSILSDGLDYTVLSVLTVPPNPEKENTMPGYIYEYTSFPALREILQGTTLSIVSGVVYDAEYAHWTRSGFIRIYDQHQSFIAVLGLDVTTETEIDHALTAFILALLYSVAATLIMVIMLARLSAQRKPRAPK